jgi:hypothetical protein
MFLLQTAENVYGMIKVDVKIAGIQFGPEDAWKFFTERVRQDLRIVFCQSASGDTFRIHARRFPALVNSMIIDWFYRWLDGLGPGTRSPRARVSPPVAPHKSCTGNTLTWEHPSPNRFAALLPEDDLTTSHIGRARTTKQGQFGFCIHHDLPLSIFDESAAQISMDYSFSKARTTRENLSNTVGRQFQ